MRRPWLPLLRCPLCRGAYDLDPVREDDGEVLEAYLVCRACRAERLVLGGVAILPRDLVAHLRTHGNVYERTPMADPRVVRFVLGQAWGGADVVPFEEVLARYGDLAPGGRARPEDAALERLLAAHAAPRGRGLDLGTGVGRGAFVLAARLGEALGADRSVARVRRARNIATTRDPFLVPAPDASGEVALDLGRLARAGTAFAVADGEALPLADGVADVVVLRAGDGEGPWASPTGVREEALRVLAPGGLLVAAEGAAEGTPGLRALGAEGPFAAWRRP